MTTKILIILFLIAYYIVAVLMCRGIKLKVKSQALGGIVCAITLVLSMIYIPLPTGATISAGSMLPIMLLAVCYDYKLAMITGWITGILAMILVPVWQPIHWAQVFIEHLVCFSCLGYAGRFGSDKKWKLVLGATIAVAIKTIAHIMSGVVFFAENAWDGFSAWAYSIGYNLSNNIPEGIITIIILLVLPVNKMKKAFR